MPEKLEIAGRMNMQIKTQFKPGQGLFATIAIKTKVNPAMVAKILQIQSQDTALSITIESKQASMPFVEPET